jgi:hypothetical protein
MANKSFVMSLIKHAASEGREDALKDARDIQYALELLTNVGSPNEVQAAEFLLNSVKKGINEVLEGKLVSHFKKEMEGFDA